jgi:hypothetical protein
MAENNRSTQRKRTGAVTGLVLLVLLGVGGYLIWTGKIVKGKPMCEVCQRQLHHGAAFVTSAANGARKLTCCPRCGLHYARTHGGRAIEATDFATGKTIPADKAVYLEGSDIMECCSTSGRRADEGTYEDVHYDRCMPSLVAFSKFEDAELVRRKHGGRVISFPEAEQNVSRQ